MNKLQKASLVLTIFAVLNYSIHTLLGFDLIYNYLNEGSLLSYLYALFVGIAGFIDITLFSNKD